MEMISSKTQQLTIRLAIALICASAAAMHSSAVLADTATSDAAAAADSTGGLEEVIVTGTRQAGQKASDSPAPIQILSSDALQKASGNPDLMSTLAQIVPSLTMQAFGFDMAGQTLQAKRALSRLAPRRAARSFARAVMTTSSRKSA
jgi:iron complex outermembrane recepter protein